MRCEDCEVGKFYFYFHFFLLVNRIAWSTASGSAPLHYPLLPSLSLPSTAPPQPPLSPFHFHLRLGEREGEKKRSTTDHAVPVGLDTLVEDLEAGTLEGALQVAVGRALTDEAV